MSKTRTKTTHKFEPKPAAKKARTRKPKPDPALEAKRPKFTFPDSPAEDVFPKRSQLDKERDASKLAELRGKRATATDTMIKRELDAEIKALESAEKGS